MEYVSVVMVLQDCFNGITWHSTFVPQVQQKESVALGPVRINLAKQHNGTKIDLTNRRKVGAESEGREYSRHNPSGGILL